MQQCLYHFMGAPGNPHQWCCFPDPTLWSHPPKIAHLHYVYPAFPWHFHQCSYIYRIESFQLPPQIYLYTATDLTAGLPVIQEQEKYDCDSSQSEFNTWLLTSYAFHGSTAWIQWRDFWKFLYLAPDPHIIDKFIQFMQLFDTHLHSEDIITRKAKIKR